MLMPYYAGIFLIADCDAGPMLRAASWFVGTEVHLDSLLRDTSLQDDGHQLRIFLIFPR
jgi:hypothetical protein